MQTTEPTTATLSPMVPLPAAFCAAARSRGLSRVARLFAAGLALAAAGMPAVAGPRRARPTRRWCRR